MQGPDNGSDLQGLHPLLKSGSLPLNFRPKLVRLPPAHLPVGFHQRLQVVNIVEMDIQQIPNGRIQVAGDGNVHHEQRTVGFAALQRPADHLLLQHILLGAGGADDDVRLRQKLGQLPIRMGGSLEP
ncbi:hypothetical protein D3C75_666210 [compost metagenome]